MRIKRLFISETIHGYKKFNHKKFMSSKDVLNYPTLKELLRDTVVEMDVESLTIFEQEFMIKMDFAGFNEDNKNKGYTLFSEIPFETTLRILGDLWLDEFINIIRIYYKFNKIDDVINELKKIVDIDIVLIMMHEALINYVNDDIVWQNSKWLSNNNDYIKTALLSNRLIENAEKITFKNGDTLSDILTTDDITKIDAETIFEIFRYNWIIDPIDPKLSLDEVEITEDNYLTPATIIGCMIEPRTQFTVNLTEYQLLYLYIENHIHRARKIHLNGDSIHFETPAKITDYNDKAKLKDYVNAKSTSNFITHMGKSARDTIDIRKRDEIRSMGHKYNTTVHVDHVDMHDFMRYMLHDKSNIFDTTGFKRFITRELGSEKMTNVLIQYYLREPITRRVVNSKDKINRTNINGVRIEDILNNHDESYYFTLSPAIIKQSFAIMCAKYKTYTVDRFELKNPREDIMSKQYQEYRYRDLSILESLIEEYGHVGLLDFIPVDMELVL